MWDQEWDVLEFVRRIRDGEFDDHIGEALDSLSPEQLRDLERFMLGEDRTGDRIGPEDPKAPVKTV